MPTVLLVRHGETAWNREGRVQGWAPTGLTDRGREQARRLGRHLAERYDVARVVASDLRRTRETVAQIRTGGVAAEPSFDPRWRERNFGVLQGFLAADLFVRHPEFDRDGHEMSVTEAPEGGESYADVHDRVVAAWEDLVQRAAPSEEALVVTHGGPLSAMLSHLTGEDLPSVVANRRFDNCTVTAVEVANGEARIRCANEAVADV